MTRKPKMKGQPAISDDVAGRDGQNGSESINNGPNRGTKGFSGAK